MQCPTASRLWVRPAVGTGANGLSFYGFSRPFATVFLTTRLRYRFQPLSNPECPRTPAESPLGPSNAPQHPKRSQTKPTAKSTPQLLQQPVLQSHPHPPTPKNRWLRFAETGGGGGQPFGVRRLARSRVVFGAAALPSRCPVARCVSPVHRRYVPPACLPLVAQASLLAVVPSSCQLASLLGSFR